LKRGDLEQWTKKGETKTKNILLSRGGKGTGEVSLRKARGLDQ